MNLLVFISKIHIVVSCDAFSVKYMRRIGNHGSLFTVLKPLSAPRCWEFAVCNKKQCIYCNESHINSLSLFLKYKSYFLIQPKFILFHLTIRYFKTARSVKLSTSNVPSLAATTIHTRARVSRPLRILHSPNYLR